MPLHNPPHPGESLRCDVLPALNMSITDLAHHLGYSRGQLSTVLNGRAAVSADLAHRLELAGISTARMWLAMQAAYDLWQAEQRSHPPITRLQHA
ncbi:HigA family addiction module antitoxin [Pseudomonas huaxiensis]|uniref:HigA family addiction module antitoxin n=1 Tax=Pseudomonas huaxiensis TaxID=2213017 RepID=UPI000DA6574D|nr:HigA family addiction module antitoxin [Pseudomonas huaxiensis]